MIRTLAAMALAAALGLGLTACGDTSEPYCRALKEAQPAFAEMADDPAGLLAQRPLLRQLAGKAPDDLTDEWQTLLSALDAFAVALDKAGIDPAEFRGAPDLAGLDDTQRAAVAQAASLLAAPDVADATNGIGQQAADVCKVQIGLG